MKKAIRRNGNVFINRSFQRSFVPFIGRYLSVFHVSGNSGAMDNQIPQEILRQLSIIIPDRTKQIYRTYLSPWLRCSVLTVDKKYDTVRTIVRKFLCSGLVIAPDSEQVIAIAEVLAYTCSINIGTTIIIAPTSTKSTTNFVVLFSTLAVFFPIFN